MHIKETTHKNSAIIFTDSPHAYTLRVTGELLTSATTFIDQFFPKFQSQKNAEAYARKNGLTVEYVLNVWKTKGKIAGDFGTHIHNFAEHRISEAGAPAEDFPLKFCGKERAYRVAVEKAIEQMRTKFLFLATEKIVFDPVIGLAGMIDVVTEDRDNGDIVLFDWKTNESIDRDNVWQNAHEPISHLESCNWNKYQLQLNLYKCICKWNDYFPGRNIRVGLVHLQPHKAVFLKVRDLTTEICDMVIHHIENQMEA